MLIKKRFLILITGFLSLQSFAESGDKLTSIQTTYTHCAKSKLAFIISDSDCGTDNIVRELLDLKRECMLNIYNSLEDPVTDAPLLLDFDQDGLLNESLTEELDACGDNKSIRLEDGRIVIRVYE